MTPLKIVFAGTPEFAATVLAALIPGPHQVIAAYSQPDRPAGRGRKLTASPVKQLAQQHQIPVYQPLNFKDPADVKTLADLQADIMVVVAYGLILPKQVLDTPRLGCINVHASLLPRWRGAAPIQRAVCAGDTESGVTIMQMDAGLDTGDMLLKVTTPITPNQTAGELHDQLAETGANACVEVLAQFASTGVTPVPQNEAEANYAHKLSKADGLIDWRQPAQVLHDQIRGLHPWPGSHTTLEGKPVRIHGSRLVQANHAQSADPGEILHASPEGLQIMTGKGVISLTHIQLPGAKAISVKDLLNARQDSFQPGVRFGT